MDNIEVSKAPGAFAAAYKEAKTLKMEKKTFNTAPISLKDQISRFAASSFSDADNKELDEDMQYI